MNPVLCSPSSELLCPLGPCVSYRRPSTTSYSNCVCEHIGVSTPYTQPWTLKCCPGHVLYSHLISCTSFRYIRVSHDSRRPFFSFAPVVLHRAITSRHPYCSVPRCQELSRLQSSVPSNVSPVPGFSIGKYRALRATSLLTIRWPRMTSLLMKRSNKVMVHEPIYSTISCSVAWNVELDTCTPIKPPLSSMNSRWAEKGFLAWSVRW